MHKFMLMFGLFVSLMFSGNAQASERPIWYRTSKGETVQSVAAKFNMSVAQLYRLNRGVQMRPGHHFLKFEEVNINPSTGMDYLGKVVWQFPGGAPFGPSLMPLFEAGMYDSLNHILRPLAKMKSDRLLPKIVAERMNAQSEFQDPQFVEMYSDSANPLVLRNLEFGKSGLVWEGVVCNWKNSVTGKRITKQVAAVWDPVLDPTTNMEYRLLIFLGCRNGATISREVEPEPIVVVVPETTRVVVPCPPAETVYVEPPVVTPPVVVPPPAPLTNRYYTDCVMWLTGEEFRIDPNGKPYSERHGENLFAGHEHTVWSSLKKSAGYRYRMSEARFNLWSSNARSGDYNLGLVWVPLSKRSLRLDLEGGMWYSAAERVYYKVTETSQNSWEFHPKKITADGFGPYVRSQLLLPLNGYADYKWRTGELLSERGGFITFRPGWLYLKAGDNLQSRNSVTRHIKPDVTFPADTMSMREVRAGIVWSKWFLTYGSWNHWHYTSDSYLFTRFGPGGGFEWNFLGSTLWRLDGDVIRFKNFDDGMWLENNELTHHRSLNREWRFKLGLVYSPATKMHSK